MTRPYAEVIGDPIAQSKSPLIHNFWLAKLGVDADYRAFRVTEAQLPDYLLQRRRDLDWRGCNVTMPLKQAVAPLVESIDDFAARAGAINTVVRDGDGLRGGNSDGAGFLEPLGPLPQDAGGYAGAACLLGTGGAARGIAVALREAGFQLDIYGRTSESARALIDAIGAGPEVGGGVISEQFFWWTAEARQAHDRHIALLVNATSLGMTGHPPLPILLDRVGDGISVYDIVTSPLETPLLKDARARGMRSFDGLQMLVGQAAVAFERFFGQPAPRTHDAELRRLLVL
ncbi:MAG: shikimate dehydrogenase [Sphingomicrobium sp.]